MKLAQTLILPLTSPPPNRGTSNHRILCLPPTASSVRRLHPALIYQESTCRLYQLTEPRTGSMHPHLHTKDNKGAPHPFPTFSVSTD